MRRRFMAVAAAIAALSATILLAPTARAQRGSRLEREDVNGRAAVAREVLVKFRSPLQTPELADVAAQTDAQAIQRVGTTGIVHLRSRSRSAVALVQALSRRPDVVYAEPNFIIQLSATPDDPRFSELWGLEQIGAPAAWDMTVGSNSNVVVGVIDTGIDYTHPDLAANVWSAPSAYTVTIGGEAIHCAAGTHGFNAITHQCNPLDDHNHGSHVSGTIGAVGNNGVGVAGINWTAQMIGIKVFDADGGATVADTIAGVEFATAVKQVFQSTDQANIRVLSASWGGPEFSQALLDEVSAAGDADMLFVAAAGNNSFNNDILPFYPASFNLPNVVAVAATSFSDNLAYFSNYGLSSVDLAAPGDFILSTTIGNTYSYMSGTSMAAPHVSGAAALVLSQCAIDTATLKDTLLSTVDHVSSLATTTATGGRLNVNSALHACTAPPEAPSSLTARGDNTRVVLTWTAGVGATGYDVKRSLVSGGPYDVVAANVKGTTYTDTAVTNGTTYYYVVSAKNSLGVSGDSNEASATPNIPPDLFVSALIAPAVGGAGLPITVSFATNNSGAGVAPLSVSRVYISLNTTLDASDRMLADVPVPELSPGGAAQASVSVTIPDDNGVGRYYVLVSADAENLLAETNENNNRLSRSIYIGPDLASATLTVPTAGAAGGTISVTDGTQNRGGGIAPPTATAFYLSANATISADDALVGSRAVPTLAVGATDTATTTLTIPATTAVGSYYLIAMTDAGDHVPETYETNNTNYRLIQIGGDLIVTSLTVPATGAPGSAIVLTDTTKNQGAASLGASTTRYYISTNPTLDAADTLLPLGREIPPLDAGVSHTGSITVTLPASLSSALYYVIAKADGDSAVSETSETNNASPAKPIQIGSDLVVSALTAPATAAAGALISVTDTTMNRGAGGATASVTRFYLSVNTILDAGDTLLTESRAVPALAGGDSSSGSSSVTLPSNTSPASYFLIAQADGAGTVPETSETNNTFARAIQIGGDLTVSVLTAPAKGGAGLSMIVTDTTTNPGAGPVGSSVTKFYFSTNSSFDAADVLLGSRDVPALGAGASSTLNTTILIPSNAAVGTSYVIARADGDGTVVETNESNNTLARSVYVGSDLIVSEPSATIKAGVGSSIDVSDTVTNQGGGASGPSTTRYYLSTNTSLSVDDVLLGGGRDVPGLAPGAVSTGSTTVWLPAGAPGVFYIIAKADGDSVVPETAETNNTASRTVAIGPDLIISASSAPSSVPAGTTITVNDTVLNQGGDAAMPTSTRIYLSTNSTLDAADIALGTGRDVPGLPAGTSNAGATSGTIPSTTPAGFYYLLAKADGDNAIAESYENNNVVYRGIYVTAAP